MLRKARVGLLFVSCWVMFFMILDKVVNKIADIGWLAIAAFILALTFLMYVLFRKFN